MLIRFGLVFLLTFVSANSAFAAGTKHKLPEAKTFDGPISLLGIELGQALSLPACPLDTSYGVTSLVRDYDIHQTCWYAYGKSSVPSDGAVDVHFDYANKPSFLQFGYINVSMRAGLVDKIDVFTNGVRDQDVVYAQLVSKFGKPQVYSKTEQANLMGAKFDVIIAEWHRKDGANVTLFGTLDKFTNGSISASSAAAEEEERARAAAHPTPSL